RPHVSPPPGASPPSRDLVPAGRRRDSRKSPIDRSRHLQGEAADVVVARVAVGSELLDPTVDRQLGRAVHQAEGEGIARSTLLRSGNRLRKPGSNQYHRKTEAQIPIHLNSPHCTAIRQRLSDSSPRRKSTLFTVVVYRP